jgi:hypothetical protein
MRAQQLVLSLMTGDHDIKGCTKLGKSLDDDCPGCAIEEVSEPVALLDHSGARWMLKS